jgi:hypothetical protein
MVIMHTMLRYSGFVRYIVKENLHCFLSINLIDNTVVLIKLTFSWGNE